MSRKNLLSGISGSTPPAPAMDRAGQEAHKAVPHGFAGRGPFGVVTRTIDDLAARASSAKDLEARLAAGSTIIELDPSIVERSFIEDRMSSDDESYASLLEAIRQHGQSSPILVRPHPVQASRYQAAFGHRRLRAAAELGRPVRAVVKHLTDLELVVAQGQENSARADLSFIERSRFAKLLEEGGHSRETIMSALGMDKTTLSRMIAVMTEIPRDIIDAIGAARGIGRDRWLELMNRFRSAGGAVAGDSLVEELRGMEATSDERFEAVMTALARLSLPLPPAPGPASSAEAGRLAGARTWRTPDGKEVARIMATKRSITLAIDARLAPGFGDYLVGELDKLYQAYSQRVAGKTRSS